jgi:hypothetical protein
MRKSPVRLLAAGMVVCLGGLLASACGGGSVPGVASLSGKSTNSSHASNATDSGTQDSGTGQTDGLKYAKCMRAHGVKNYPDPNKTGATKITPSMGINLTSPTFQAAMKDCQSLQPTGGKLSPAKQQQMKKNALDFSKCMRAHGIRNFPDPQFPKSGVGIAIKITASSGIDPNSPTFQAAQQACGKYMHIGKAGQHTSSTTGSGKVTQVGGG